MTAVSEASTMAPGADAAGAAEALLAKYGGRVRALALRMCRNEADADDLVQEVFLQAFRRWETFRGEADPGTWLYAIAGRACRKWMRKRRGGAGREVPAFGRLLPFGDTKVMELAARDGRAGAGSAGEPERREAIAAVRRGIATLPEHFRVPLVLKEVLELPVADVAAALGLKEDTVKTRLHRARLLLRQAMARRAERVDAPAPIYEKQVCLDLLKSKLDAMDRGRAEAFRVTQSEMCTRCRAVFAELDLVQNACAELAKDEMPAALRASIRRAIRTRDRAEAGPGSGGKRRGRRPVRARSL